MIDVADISDASAAELPFDAVKARLLAQLVEPTFATVLWARRTSRGWDLYLHALVQYLAISPIGRWCTSKATAPRPRRRPGPGRN